MILALRIHASYFTVIQSYFLFTGFCFSSEHKIVWQMICPHRIDTSVFLIFLQMLDKSNTSEFVPLIMFVRCPWIFEAKCGNSSTVIVFRSLSFRIEIICLTFCIVSGSGSKTLRGMWNEIDDDG